MSDKPLERCKLDDYFRSGIDNHPQSKILFSSFKSLFLYNPIELQELFNFSIENVKLFQKQISQNIEHQCDTAWNMLMKQQNNNLLFMENGIAELKLQIGLTELVGPGESNITEQVIIKEFKCILITAAYKANLFNAVSYLNFSIMTLFTKLKELVFAFKSPWIVQGELASRSYV